MSGNITTLRILQASRKCKQRTNLIILSDKVFQSSEVLIRVNTPLESVIEVNVVTRRVSPTRQHEEYKKEVPFPWKKGP